MIFILHSVLPVEVKLIIDDIRQFFRLGAYLEQLLAQNFVLRIRQQQEIWHDWLTGLDGLTCGGRWEPRRWRGRFLYYWLLNFFFLHRYWQWSFPWDVRLRLPQDRFRLGLLLFYYRLWLFNKQYLLQRCLCDFYRFTFA